MATIGDLFVNVRAKTQGLNSGLRKANRSISSFASSAAKSIAAIAGGFALFKGLKKIGGMFFSSLMYKSQEFRTAWANINNQLVDTFGQLAQRWGPALARVLDSLAEKIWKFSMALRHIPWEHLWKEAKKKIPELPSGVAGSVISAGVPQAMARLSVAKGGAPTVDAMTELVASLVRAATQAGSGLWNDEAPKPVIIVDGGPA